jgi:hypothetical protein
MKTQKATQRKLYFDAWSVCIKYHLREAYMLRRPDPAYITQLIESRRLWQQRINYGGSWRRPESQIDPTVSQDLYTWCDFLASNITPKKITYNGNFMYIYCNDPDLVLNLKSMPGTVLQISQVQNPGDSNTIYLKNPQHQYRSYFRAYQCSSEQKQNITQFLQAQQSEIKLSPSLDRWINSHKNLMALDYYFIDHDSTAVLTFLSLINPKIIRKTLSIEADK